MKRYLYLKTGDGKSVRVGQVGAALLMAFQANHKEQPEAVHDRLPNVRIYAVIKRWLSVKANNLEDALKELGVEGLVSASQESFCIEDFFEVIKQEIDSNIVGFVIGSMPMEDWGTSCYVSSHFTLLESTERPKILGPMLERLEENGEFAEYAASISNFYVEPLVRDLPPSAKNAVVNALIEALKKQHSLVSV